MSATALVRTADPREAALLKAVGLDKVPPEQRELAMHIADRYDLDLMLKHLVLVDGRPYITRDGLLHVAHRSGVFDGIEVTDPVLGDTHWSARATVYRKDMTRGFTYSGRYPKTGGNARFAPEMAVKVAEVMSLRRAFDVSAAVIEERWDMDVDTQPVEPRQPVSIAAKAAGARARIEARTDEPTPDDPVEEAPLPVEPAVVDVKTGEVTEGELVRCESVSPYEEAGQCRRESGHDGNHRGSSKESW